MKRAKIAVVVTEFLGTYVLVSAVLAMVTRTQFPFFAALTAGVVLATITVALGKSAIPVLNPAITVALWTVRKIETSTALIYIVVQMLAGFIAYRLNPYMIDTTLRNIAGTGLDWRIIIAEALGTFVLALGVSAIVFERMDHVKAAGVLAVSLMVGIVLASLGSNQALNPAVALGIHSWSAAYVVGPIIGAVVGMNLYALLYAPQEKLVSRNKKR